ncbi:imidazole glycerol phosphate synthase subunit HisH [Capsulimonas corticalis]|uniref:Imidazole glycerol phosphate synthase subunit HisH n=1 Tax=Capsulimonas corticalis TaxID=2219043 RepID=A0A402D373_9BACT|nr:imidazole glycerol phosphate synthase subunit HisH [Capsulimonas corticalis]BDI28476.1 imidazole glycerol phosphate synthase subunit HisH [Capsulimonas corticalis]
MKIAIIDYGMGNLRSVEKAFHKIGAAGAFVTSDPAEIFASDKAVLPGDGAFDSTMHSLRESGIDKISLDFIASGRPFLGICVGMQVLLTTSEEGEPGVRGLDVVPGQVKRFTGDGLKVPQIGWNNINFTPGAPLAHGQPAGDPMAYFLNSYYCAPDDPADIAATTDYGVTFCSAIHRGNVWATQFHPEKSGLVGLAILESFSEV